MFNDIGNIWGLFISADCQFCSITPYLRSNKNKKVICENLQAQRAHSRAVGSEGGRTLIY